MGGRIVEQVRRALILAAKTGPVVVAIDATGCTREDDEYPCATPGPPCKEVPATGRYVFEASASTEFSDSEICRSRYPATSVELPVESCKEFCADPRYFLYDKYSDTDTIVSCSTYHTGSMQPPPGCFPLDVTCVAEYPPGAVKCADAGAWFHGGGGYGASKAGGSGGRAGANTGGRSSVGGTMGMGGRDAGKRDASVDAPAPDTSDASADTQKPDATVGDASKDGG